VQVYSESLARAGVVYLEGRARLVEPQGVEINGSVLKVGAAAVPPRPPYIMCRSGNFLNCPLA